MTTQAAKRVLEAYLRQQRALPPDPENPPRPLNVVAALAGAIEAEQRCEALIDPQPASTTASRDITET